MVFQEGQGLYGTISTLEDTTTLTWTLQNWAELKLNQKCKSRTFHVFGAECNLRITKVNIVRRAVPPAEDAKNDSDWALGHALLPVLEVHTSSIGGFDTHFIFGVLNPVGGDYPSQGIIVPFSPQTNKTFKFKTWDVSLGHLLSLGITIRLSWKRTTTPATFSARVANPATVSPRVAPPPSRPPSRPPRTRPSSGPSSRVDM